MALVALERYNAIRLVQTVHSSLASLNRVLRGSSLLTPAVQKLASSLLKNEVNFLQIAIAIPRVYSRTSDKGHSILRIQYKTLL